MKTTAPSRSSKAKFLISIEQSARSRPSSTRRLRVEQLKRPGDRPAVGLPFEFRVAGTGYDRRYTAIRRYGRPRSPIRLTPERDNPHDKHAIAVHMGWTNDAGREMWDQIGYVPAEASEIVNGLLASGEWAIESAIVWRLDASPELDSPRVIVRLEGKDLRKPRATRNGKP